MSVSGKALAAGVLVAAMLFQNPRLAPCGSPRRLVHQLRDGCQARSVTGG